MIKGYEVSYTGGDGWEEISVEDFINRENLTNKEIESFKNTHFATNMHIMISKETLSMAYETLNDILNKEERLNGLNAIVFLSLKKKGRGIGHTQLSDEEFSRLTHFCLDNGISFGFDSCSCIKFLKSIKNSEDEEKLTTVSEPCESTRFSLYVDTHGKMYPCSFYEGVDGWEDGISVSECNDFIEDVWNHKKTVKFRNKCVSCINNGVACQYYNI